MSPPAITVRAEPALSDEDRDTIVAGLIAYNTGQGAVWNRSPVNVLARDPDDAIVGGLTGDVNLGWLFVSALWVREDRRGSGIGSELVRAAEQEARGRGCLGVFLDTYSFQARPFYEKLGFRLFGELPDCPPGGSKYYLCKRLDRP